MAPTAQTLGTPASASDTLRGSSAARGPGPGCEIVLRRHVEWHEHQVIWRWLQDSYEGGSRYRNAVYGLDQRGLPVRNLIRHKREYPNPRDQAFTSSGYSALPAAAPPLGTRSGLGLFPGQLGADAAALATDDPYEYR